MKARQYNIGDVINIDDVNHIKNKLYKDEYAKRKGGYPEKREEWCKLKKAIKNGCEFKIVSLYSSTH